MVFATLRAYTETCRHRGNGAKTLRGNAMTCLSARRASMFAGGILLALALTMFAHDVRAEDAPKPPSAAQSDPVANSVMQGFPPPADKIAGLRRFVTFDPKETLLKVSSTPTLALYGALDRNVDAADSATHLREYLRRAGNRDVTIKTYPDAGHQLVVSKSGYNGDPTPPERFVAQYPQIMITWLAARGFTPARAPPAR